MKPNEIPIQDPRCIFFLQLPEMNLAADEEEKESGKIWMAFVLQNLGIIIGFCIILVMSVYGGEINFD